jgi:hypothetical protein
VTYLEAFTVDDLLTAVTAMRKLEPDTMTPLDLTREFDPLRDALRSAAGL